LRGLLSPPLYKHQFSSGSCLEDKRLQRLSELISDVLSKTVVSIVLGFKRGPGSPRINWRDIVNKDIQRMGLTWEEVEASAQDRQTWRQHVALCIGDAG